MKTVFAALLLTGCATLQPPPPVEVQVPVTTPCVSELPPYPDLRAPDAWTKNVFEKTKALLIDRQLLVAHVETLRAMLEACK